MMEQIFAKVEKQELEISYIKKTLDELVEQNKKQNEQLIKISESIQKQEIIIEKISNLEDKYQEGIKRVHKRIDEELERCKEKTSFLKDEVDKLKNDLSLRPCQNHQIVDKELEYIKKQVERHSKIVWWGGTLIIGVIVIAIIKSHFKQEK